jgi:hypothetical protein
MSEPSSAFREAKAERNILRWIFGWHPVVGPVMVGFFVAGVGYYLGQLYLFALIGLLLGVPIWYLGHRSINRHWETLRAAYMQDLEQYGPAALHAAGMDEDGELFVLTETPDGTMPLIEAPSTIEVTLVGIDDTGLWINDESKLDLMFLKAAVNTTPMAVYQFPWSNLAGVTYEDGTLHVEPERETEDVEPFETTLSTAPTELLSAIERRRLEPTADH